MNDLFDLKQSLIRKEPFKNWETDTPDYVLHPGVLRPRLFIMEFVHHISSNTNKLLNK